MTYTEETFVLNTLKELKEFIRSPTYSQLIQETDENNIRLKQIIKYLNNEIDYANQENSNNFNMNIIVNIINSIFDINKLFKR